MNFKYRVKVLGKTIDQLTAMGFAINTHACATGEYWVLGSSLFSLEDRVKRNDLTTISKYEAF